MSGVILATLLAVVDAATEAGTWGYYASVAAGATVGIAVPCIVMVAVRTVFI